MNQFTKLLGIVCLTLLITPESTKAGVIHDAAAAGDLNKVKVLLEADPTLIESKDEDGNTPLISACWGPPANIPKVAVANFLIDKGANINARNNNGGTPLYFAIKDFDLTQRLIDKGAEVKIRAFGDYTPLHQAALSGNLKIAKLLIDHGADVTASGTEGTIIHYIIKNTNQPDEQIIQLLVESGTKLNQNFSFGNAELHLAVFNVLTEIIPILVKLGADVNAVNEYGHTPLYYAAMHGYRKTADALSVAGADKSTILETNYSKAPQLKESLKKGEAYLWYLGGNSTPYLGYAVKTKNNLLIFNPTNIDESMEAGLANGSLNPNELADQKITALILYKSYQGRFDKPSISELAKRLPITNLVLNFEPIPDTTYSNFIPPYKLAAPHENYSLGDMQVHTIPAVGKVWFGGEAMSYLVEVDGLKIFHTGLHVTGNDPTDIEKYRKEIDFLKPFGPVDIVILPVNGNHVWWIDYESYFYMIDQLSPKSIYLIGDTSSKGEHKKCIEILKARDVPVFYPDGGIAVGQRFHYERE
ncbi:MAG: ankyrin repeat domain-containing protein [Calditrichaceae bacterium]|nr:ankyrin repeat domain-containing protein [Calditrichaceae bacterium]